MTRLSPFVILTAALCILQSSFALPLYRDSLPNGLVVLTYEDHRLPMVDLSLVCRSGAAFDPSGKVGTADLTADMLTRGTKTMSADSLASLVEFLGAEVNSGADHDAATVSGRLLSKDLDQGLDLLADAVLNPSFDSKEFAQLKGQALAGARRRLDNPGALVGDEFNRLLYGDHPYARPASGDTGSLPRISRQDLLDFYGTHFKPNNCFLVAVGDLERTRLVQAAKERFGAWQPAAVPRVSPAAPAFPDRVKVKLITRPDMNQTYIEFGHPGTSALDADMLATRLMSYILGGAAMSSRLGASVREEAGLAYDVRCWFDRRLLPGAFHATVQTARPNDAVERMFREVSLMHESGANQAELTKAHNYYTGSFPLTYSSNRGKLMSTRVLEQYAFGPDWLVRFPDKVRAISLDQVNQAARDHLRPGNYLMVVMGNVTREDLALGDVEWVE